MFSIGQKVCREFGSQIMTVVGFEPELIENVITEWQDQDGNLLTGKFMESELNVVSETES